MFRNIKKITLILNIFIIYNLIIIDSKAEDSSMLLNKSPINIESSSLEIIDSEKIAIFEGKVRVNQENITISSDKLVLSYAFNSITKSIDIQKILCSGNVLIEFDNQIVTSETAEYNLIVNQLILQNDVIISRGEGNAIKAEKVTVDLDTMRTKMDSSERVKAFITPPNN